MRTKKHYSFSRYSVKGFAGSHLITIDGNASTIHTLCGIEASINEAVPTAKRPTCSKCLAVAKQR